uniref:Uncharacterized protein n=1 Tax=Parascaris equorum TaxID=6256 RepID=A0A914RW26_PAREQ
MNATHHKKRAVDYAAGHKPPTNSALYDRCFVALNHPSCDGRMKVDESKDALSDTSLLIFDIVLVQLGLSLFEEANSALMWMMADPPWLAISG